MTAPCIPARLLGDFFEASAVSYGAMGLSEFYGDRPDDKAALRTLERAVSLGVSMIDTADMYGRGHNETLIGALVMRRKADFLAGRIKIATKFGIERDPNDPYKRRLNNSPDYIRKSVDASLSRLKIERIDLYYIHRIDPAAKLEDTVETLARLVREGKIAHIGLCEISPRTLERACALHPIAAVQSEYSLWTRDMERDLLPTARRLGVGFVAYSPLGRGFLSGAYRAAADFQPGDFRRANPRFQPRALERNLELLRPLAEIAEQRGATAAQIALAWLLAKEERLVVIPGARSIAHLEENCAAARISLSSDETARLDAAFPAGAAFGQRYTEEGMKGLDA